ncbi:MAG: ribonuclease domain-containing protein [Aquabacterium sp.]|uniref:ribonuclease domain-containing protein n=1 Tax=Aquabacterium sp. TaxID=1872578 RepID=UPI002723866E|nr:ribonuclease domain-containing protein [Aquabacterium sp.]MDO9005722.1 ribonuclease domain-containing protein [Aquabacterium sp.]
MTYDGLGNKDTYTNKLGGIYTYTYYKTGLLKTERLPESAYAYDATTGKPTGDLQDVINYYEYDARGNRTKSIEAQGLSPRVTIYTYDKLDRQISKATQSATASTFTQVEPVPGVWYFNTFYDTSTVANPFDTATRSTSVATLTMVDIAGGVQISLSQPPSDFPEQTSAGTYISGLWLNGTWGTVSPVSGVSVSGGSVGAPTIFRDGGYIYNGSLGFASTGINEGGASVFTILGAGVSVANFSTSTNHPMIELSNVGSPYTNFLSKGKVSFISFPDQGKLVSTPVTQAPTETRTYDARGNLIEVKAADDGRTLTYWDANNRKIAEISPVGTLATFTYDKVGSLIEQRVFEDPVTLPPLAGGTPPQPANAAKVRETQYTYDANRRLINTTTKDVNVGEINPVTGNYEVTTRDVITTKQYDANGNLTLETDGRGATIWRYYDKANNLKLQIDGERYVSYWSDHDASGNVTDQTLYGAKLPDSFVLRTDVDWWNIVLAMPTTDARRTSFGRDRLGRITQQTVYRNDSESFDTTIPLTPITTYFQYNGADKLTQKTEATGEVLTWQYDQQGRLTKTLGAKFTDYKGVADRQQVVSTEYDGLSLVARSIERADPLVDSDDDRISITRYDTDGRVLSETDAVGNVTHYQYDLAGHVTQKSITRKDAADTASTDITAYAYDTAGRQVSQWVFNVAGTTSTLPATAKSIQTQDTQYNAFGEITGKRTYGGFKSSIWQETATYDNTGHAVISNVGTGVTKGYVFDANGNATMTIESTGVDLSGLSVDAMLARSDVHLIASKYDKRNQLVETVQAKLANVNTAATIPPLITTSPGQSTGAVVTVGANATPTQAASISRGIIQVSKASGPVTITGTNYSDEGLYLGVLTLPDTTGMGDGDIVVRTYQQPYTVFLRNGTTSFNFAGILGQYYSGNEGMYNDGYRFAESVYVAKVMSDGSEVRVAYYTVDPISSMPQGAFSIAANAAPQFQSMGIVDGEVNLHGLPSNLTSDVVIYYRSKSNPAAAWTILAKEYGNQLTPLPVGSYDYKYFFSDASGGWTSQTGAIDSTPARPVVTQDPPLPANRPQVVLESDGYMSLFGFNTKTLSINIKVRPKGSTQPWTTASLPSSTISRLYDSSGSRFKFKPTAAPFNLANGAEYEYLVTTFNGANASGNQLDVGLGAFKVGDANAVSNGAPILLDNLPTTVHFQNLATSGTVARLSYRASAAGGSPAGSWQSGNIALKSSGSFDWDAIAAAPDKSQSYGLDYELQVFDAGGRLLHSFTGSVTIGASQAATSTVNTMPAAQNLVFNPGLIAANSLQLHFRPVGSASDFVVTTTKNTPLVATNTPTFTAINLPSWAQSFGVLPAQGADFEYYYEVLNSSSQVIAGSAGWPSSPARMHLDASTQATSSARSVVLGFANPAQAARTSQVRNAFGEIVSQTDANGNTTTLKYNNVGSLIEKKEASALITAENGYRAADTPTTNYYYDKQGRLVQIKDANQNVSRQTWTAEGVDGQSHLSVETHADPGVQTSGYDQFGDLRSVKLSHGNLPTDANVITMMDYYANHLVKTVTRPLRTDKSVSAWDSYTYDAVGNRISHTTSSDGTTPIKDTTAYDALGRVTSTTTAFPHTTTTTYVWDASMKGINGNTVGGWTVTSKNAITESDPTLNYAPNTIIDKKDVFGHQMSHRDLGGHLFTYTYNGAGWLTTQKSTGSTTASQNSGQDILYDYYADGRVKSIIDNVQKTQTLYGYDANGNKTYEGYATQTNSVWSFSQQSTVVYDALNRITSITDPTNSINYEYDAVGNRRRVKTRGSYAVTHDYWYSYDSMNRFTVTMGSLLDKDKKVITDTSTILKTAANTIDIGTVAASNSAVHLTYDAAGQRVGAKYGTDGRRERYEYTADGYLKNVYFLASAPGSTEWTASQRDIDLMGRVTKYTEYSAANVQKSWQSFVYNADSKVSNSSSWSATAAIGTSTTQNTLLGDGTLLSSSTSTTANGSTSSSSTSYLYQWWDSAMQSRITQTGSTGAGVSNFTYDVNGHVSTVTDTVGGRNLRYLNNAQGLIMMRDEIGSGGTINKHQNYFYFDGQRVGEVGNNPGPTQVDYAQALAASPNVDRKAAYRINQPITSNYDQNYQAINASYPGYSSTGYVVRQQGEKLSSIASAVWGDGTLWYLIADANGMSADTETKAGQTLVIPNKVTNVHNNTQTHKVYDATDAMGDTSPTLPDPPPPPKPKKGCGGLGMILMVVVAVVATIFTAGAALTVLAPSLTTGMTVMGAGMTALAGSAGMAGLAAAAIGGAIGSIASQLVGMATGDVQKFSWSGVAMGAISAGAGAGAGAIVGVASQGASTATQLAYAVGRSVVGNVIGQGVAQAVGLQQKFSWTSVASSAVGAAASFGVQELIGNAQWGGQWDARLDQGQFGDAARTAINGDWVGSTLRGTASNLAGSWAGSMAAHKKVQWQSVAASSFGSALGNSVVGAIVQADTDNQKRRDALYGLASGTKPSLTGRKLDINGSRLGIDAARQWSEEINDGIKTKAQGLANFDRAANVVWAREDLQSAREAMQNRATAPSRSSQRSSKAIQSESQKNAYLDAMQAGVDAFKGSTLPAISSLAAGRPVRVAVSPSGAANSAGQIPTGPNELLTAREQAVAATIYAGVTLAVLTGGELAPVVMGLGRQALTMGPINTYLANAATVNALGITGAGMALETSVGVVSPGNMIGSLEGRATRGLGSLAFDNFLENSSGYRAFDNFVANSVGDARNVATFTRYKQVLSVSEQANPLVDSLRAIGRLPDNFVTKQEAIAAGWRPGTALNNYVPGGQLGGDVFHNTTNVLPSAPGRVWYEADIGLSGTMSRANQLGTRLLYSNDRQMYITTDHYKTVHPFGGQ